MRSLLTYQDNSETTGRTEREHDAEAEADRQLAVLRDGTVANWSGPRCPHYCRPRRDPTVFVYTLLNSAPQKNSCAE
jgi:hypothetical protein